ncbi:MAG: DUF420 domain-containing protein [Flavobacteriales bacterium]|nr:DUF420 domain-containing protein [Flavobacteriales bacterium]
MKNDKLVFRIALAVSALVFVLVIILNRKLITPPETPAFVFQFPKIIAAINAVCSVLLILSFRAIKQKKVALHKKYNLTTFALSALFLIFYVTFHFFVDETTFGGTGIVRPIYYFILITHIVLAAIILPLILMSFYYGLNNKVEKHRKLVKWTFPLWLYVTVSGVIVYFMISPHYPF